MSNWNLPGKSGSFYAMGADASDSSGVAVTSGTRTLGSWTEISSSAPADLGEIYVLITGQSTPLAGDSGYFEIGVGTAASEQTIATGHFSDTRQSAFWQHFPVQIPSGSRIAIRASNHSANSYDVILFGRDRGSLGEDLICSGIEMCGVETAGGSTTHGRGVSVDPGGTANTKGSWTEVISATTYDHRNGVINIHFNNGAAANASWLVDFAIGGSGSEEVIMSDLFFSVSTNESFNPIQFIFTNKSIPSGTRLAVRAQCSITDATDRLLYASYLGFK